MTAPCPRPRARAHSRWWRRHPATRRALHPGAWWLWAGGLAAAAMRTTNPFLLALIIGVVAYVVAARRTSAPWARSFGSFARLAVVVVVFRMMIQILVGERLPGTTLFTLPSVALPSWMAGVSLGGPVTLEALVDGVQPGPATRRGAHLLRRGELAVQPVPDAAGAPGRALRGRRGGHGGAVVRAPGGAPGRPHPRGPTPPGSSGAGRGGPAGHGAAGAGGGARPVGRARRFDGHARLRPAGDGRPRGAPHHVDHDRCRAAGGGGRVVRRARRRRAAGPRAAAARAGLGGPGREPVRRRPPGGAHPLPARSLAAGRVRRVALRDGGPRRDDRRGPAARRPAGPEPAGLPADLADPAAGRGGRHRRRPPAVGGRAPAAGLRGPRTPNW